jgi:sphingolipid delta-4 desaturase
MDYKTSYWRSLFFSALSLDFKIENDKDLDFVYTQEPHTPRRQAILQKYPEIKKLMGHDSNIALIVTVEVLIQIAACWIISLLSPSYPLLLIAAYCFGGVVNHSLGSAIHEIGHNLAFGHARPRANRVLSLFCNLPIGIPMAISYKKYHADHHRWLGHDENDVDIPMRIESLLFRHTITKILWLILFPFIHAVRPFFKSPRPISVWEIINIAVQLSFDAVIFKVFGEKALLYLIAGTALGMGLHPLAGHFLSEHYLFREGQATMSYYGPLNLVFNFPNITLY